MTTATPINEPMINSFHRMMKTSKEQQIASIKTNIDQGTREYNTIFQKLVRISGEIEGDKGRIKVLMSRTDTDTRSLWNQIQNLDAVEQFVINYCICGECARGTISIYTKPLWCVDDRTQLNHRIGSFKIVVDLHRRSISWYNLDYTICGYDRQNMQAPHVFKDGHACMGSSQNHFEQLLGFRDIYQIIILGIQFCESVNTTDAAGKHIDKWPYEIGGKMYYDPHLTMSPHMGARSEFDPDPVLRSGWVEKEMYQQNEEGCTCPDCMDYDDEDDYDEEEEDYDEEDEDYDDTNY